MDANVSGKQFKSNLPYVQDMSNCIKPVVSILSFWTPLLPQEHNFVQHHVYTVHAKGNSLN